MRLTLRPLRAAVLAGALLLLAAPVTSGIGASGSMTVTVPTTWAGPLRIIAVTERDGIPISTKPFPTTFTVVRPTLAAPAGVRGSRVGATSRVSWRRVAGGTSYDVQFQVPRSKPAMVTSTTPQVALPTTTAAAIRIRVRAVTRAGLPGRWSAWTTIKPAPKPRPSRR
jgi:hypothetical protein